MAVTSYVFGGTRSCFFFMEGIFFLFLLLISIHPTVKRTKHNQVFVVTKLLRKEPYTHMGFHLQTYFNWSTIQSTPGPGWALKWLNVITWSRWRTTESGSVTWLGTRPSKNPLGGSSSKMHDFKHIVFITFFIFCPLVSPFTSLNCVQNLSNKNFPPKSGQDWGSTWRLDLHWRKEVWNQLNWRIVFCNEGLFINWNVVHFEIDTPNSAHVIDTSYAFRKPFSVIS